MHLEIVDKFESLILLEQKPLCQITFSDFLAAMIPAALGRSVPTLQRTYNLIYKSSPEGISSHDLYCVAEAHGLAPDCSNIENWLPGGVQRLTLETFTQLVLPGSPVPASVAEAAEHEASTDSEGITAVRLGQP